MVHQSYYLQTNRSNLFSVELNFHAKWHVPVAFEVVCDSRYLWTFKSAFRISAGIVFTFSDCNRVLFSFGLIWASLETIVLAVSVGGETKLDLLEAETRIPAIKSALTDNSAKHDLAFLEDRRNPDDCIMNNREPIDVGLVYQTRIDLSIPVPTDSQPLNTLNIRGLHLLRHGVKTKLGKCLFLSFLIAWSLFTDIVTLLASFDYFSKFA